MTEQEEEFNTYRENELSSVFVNLASIKPFHEQLIRTLA